MIRTTINPYIKAWLIMVGLAGILYSGCDKVDELTQFDMEYTSEVTIPASSGIDLPINIFTPDIETNSEQMFQLNDTRKDKIEEINLKTMQLTVLMPEGEDFSFLKSIEIYIEADGLSESRIAWKENIPDDVGNELDMNTTDEDLKEYIKKDEFKLRVKTLMDELIDQDHEIEVYSVFRVDAEVLGQ